jgi:hypothetical protein
VGVWGFIWVALRVWPVMLSVSSLVVLWGRSLGLLNPSLSAAVCQGVYMGVFANNPCSAAHRPSLFRGVHERWKTFLFFMGLHVCWPVLSLVAA